MSISTWLSRAQIIWLGSMAAFLAAGAAIPDALVATVLLSIEAIALVIFVCIQVAEDRGNGRPFFRNASIWIAVVLVLLTTVAGFRTARKWQDELAAPFDKMCNSAADTGTAVASFLAPFQELAKAPVYGGPDWDRVKDLATDLVQAARETDNGHFDSLTSQVLSNFSLVPPSASGTALPYFTLGYTALGKIVMWCVDEGHLEKPQNEPSELEPPNAAIRKACYTLNALIGSFNSAIADGEVDNLEGNDLMFTASSLGLSAQPGTDLSVPELANSTLGKPAYNIANEIWLRLNNAGRPGTDSALIVQSEGAARTVCQAEASINLDSGAWDEAARATWPTR